MRLLFLLIRNLLALLWAALLTPLRLLGRPRADYLAVELSGDLPWRKGPRPVIRVGQADHGPLRPFSLSQLSRVLAEVARDPRLKGVIFKVENLHLTGARLAALRALAARLKAAGKDVVFYGRAVTGREYALMTAGRIQMAPGGTIDLSGVSADLFVFGETLARLGVHPEFIRRSEYKTAPELFTDRQVSEAQKETTGKLLGEVHERLVALVAEGRSKTPEEVARLVDEGPYSSAQALQAGLVDAVGDGEDLETWLAPPGEGKASGKEKQKAPKGGKEGQEKEKPPRARLLPMRAYPGTRVFRPRLKAARRKDVVAVVPVRGAISLGDGPRGPLGGSGAGSDAIVRMLRAVREDHAVKAVILAIDSPGGSALASELIHKAVQRVAGEKPIIAYLEQVAASGGYMAAVGASHVLAAPQSVVGSIGVFGGKFEFSRLLEKAGVGTAVIRYGRHGSLQSPLLPWNEDERAALERHIEETYQSFLKIVADGRKMTVEQVLPLAGGRVYSGTRAHALNLVDALGDFEDAVRKARELAGLAREPQVVQLGERRKVGLASLLRPGAAALDPALPQALELAEELRPLLNEQVLALAPLWRIRPGTL